MICRSLVMAPKKRQRTSNNNKAGTLVPEKMSDVSAARIELRDWITQCYQGRHGFSQSRKFPLEDGGSFLDIVQRCFCDEGAMIDKSLDLTKKLGILSADATEDHFAEKFLTLQD